MQPLFAALAATWPAAETVRLGGWTLRRGAGGGARVSAATLDGPVDGAVDGPPSGIEAAEAAMRRWGQRPRVMIRPGDEALDAELAARGWEAVHPSLLLAAPAAAIALEAPLEEAIACDGPLACMTAIWAGGGIGRERLAVMERAPAPRTWLLGRHGERAVACGFVAAHAGVAMLHALEVAPEARRRGVAGVLTRAAASWGLAHGADTLALAARAGNDAARGLYGRLGLAEAARYRYRAAPGAD